MGATTSSRSRQFGNVEKFVEPCILLLLSKNDSHGYGLMDDLERQCDHKVDIGNLYRTLRKMEKNRWITSFWLKGTIGPKKRTYRITAAGKSVLHDAVASLTITHNLLSRFLKGYKKTFWGKSLL